LFEIVKGKRVEKKMGLVENMIASVLHELLSSFCRQQQLGRAPVETLFRLPGSSNDRRPDVAFVSYTTWPRDRPLPLSNAWTVAPDLVIEVICPTDSAFDVFNKVFEYFDGGVKQVWQIYSNVHRVLVFDSPQSARILSGGDELTAESILPGFRVKVEDLFPLTEPVA
jgi:Uma2 family endonuclease